MSRKRMFDNAILETDNFMDLPMSGKALYFLLGMEADDEGFVSPKRVMRIHGGNDDDLKVLIAKGLVIPFKSGVVVITDWHTNNWLDSRRTKPTRYQQEKSELVLFGVGESKNDKKYMLSKCLASAEPEENRIEEKRIKENRREENNNTDAIASPSSTKDLINPFSKKPKFLQR